MEAADVEEVVPDEDAIPVCEFCLEPLPHEYALFCPECRAPIEPLAAIIPFVRIFAEGFLLRRAAEQATKLITVIGIWIIFLIPAVIFLVPAVLMAIGFVSSLFLGEMEILSPFEFFYSLISTPIIVAIGFGISFRVTRSYLASRNAPPEKAEGPSGEGPSQEI